MWSLTRALDVDTGHEPRSDPLPDADAAFTRYLRSAGRISLVAGDTQSWTRAFDDIAKSGAAHSQCAS